MNCSPSNELSMFLLIFMVECKSFFYETSIKMLSSLQRKLYFVTGKQGVSYTRLHDAEVTKQNKQGRVIELVEKSSHFLTKIQKYNF